MKTNEWIVYKDMGGHTAQAIDRVRATSANAAIESVKQKYPEHKNDKLRAWIVSSTEQVAD